MVIYNVPMSCVMTCFCGEICLSFCKHFWVYFIGAMCNYRVVVAVRTITFECKLSMDKLVLSARVPNT